jgi:DNA invertase Pin-like site-specific DNA recombinase
MVSRGDYVAYYRVSTKRQGRSGLGIDAQRTAVEGYLNGGRWKIIEEYIEVESGKRADRPALDFALARAKAHRAPLVVAKVDRLTRSVSFLSKIIESGVDVRFADLPSLEGATGKFMLTQMAAVAELEAGLISARTKAALAAAKKRGTKLGGNRGPIISRAARMAGCAARTARAQARALELSSTVAEIRKAGATTYAAIAAALNERGIPTSRQVGDWTAMQAARLVARLDQEKR